MKSRTGAAGWWRQEGLLPAACAVAALAIRLFCGPHPVDDAYITFRYARNLAAGLGLVYNPGEHVLGTSAPLMAGLLAGFARLFGPEGIPWYAVLVNAGADGFLAMLVYGLARRIGLSRTWSVWAGMMQGLAPLSIRYAIGGLETSLVAALTLGAFAAHLGRRDQVAANLAGLSVLLRPDALAVAALLVAAEVLRRRPPWRTLAILAAWTVPGAILSWWFYGLPLPHTVIAKSAPIYTAPPWTNAGQFVLQFGGTIAGSPLGIGAHGIVLWPTATMLMVVGPAAVVQLCLAWAGARRMLCQDMRWGAAIAYPLVYAGVYSALGWRGSVMAEWYTVPLVPIYLLMIAAGLEVVLGRVQRWGTVGRMFAPSLALGLILSQIAGLNLGRDRERPFLLPRAVWDEREQLYAQAADFLSAHAASGARVAAPEIGALGYACECRILDTVGLVSPEALSYYPLPPEQVVALNAVPLELIEATQPEVVVSLEVFMRRTLLQDEWFLGRYTPIWHAETTAFGSAGMWIFARAGWSRSGSE